MLPILFFGGWFMSKFLQEGSKKNRGAFEKAGGIAEEVIYNIKTVASFANFDWEKKRFYENLQESYTAGKKNALKAGVGNGILFLAIFGTYCLAIWYGSVLIYNKQKNGNTGKDFQAGDVLICLFTIVFGAFSLGQASPSIKAIFEACSAASDFYELKRRIPKIDLTHSIKRPDKDTIHGRIQFKNVSFAYPAKPEKIILNDLNLEIEPGKKVAFVGRSGCGKSTIVNLIERLYDISSGQLLIDGHNLKELDLEYFRSLIGYVPQEPVLFNTSIRENIIFGRKNITEDMIVEACKKAYAEEFINANIFGLDYIVGVKGSKLSGGQKQRIAIARAILCRPKLLILDEATSALDNRSEKEVQKALDQVSQDITTIIIAHRLSTIINSNKILVLHKGKIVEEGTHEQLMSRPGRYHRLFKSQAGTVDEELHRNDAAEQRVSENSNEQANLVEKKELKDEEAVRKEEMERLIRIKNEKEEMVKKNKKKLLPIIMENKAVVITGTIAAMASGACWPAYGLLLAESIATLSDRDPNIVRNNGFQLSMFFLALAGAAAISTFLQNTMFNIQGEYLAKRLREIIYDKYLRLPMGYYDHVDNTPGSLLTKLASDTTSVNGIALGMLSITVQTISTLIIGITMGLIYEWRIGLITIGFVPFILMTSGLQWRLMQSLGNKDEYLESQAGSILSESVCNSKTIYSYNMQAKVVEMYVKILESKDKTLNKSSFINGVLFGLSQFFMFATYATVFYAGSRFMADPDPAHQLSLDHFLKGVFCIIFAAFGLGQAQQYIGDMGKSRDAFVNIFKTIDEPTTIDPFADSTNLNTNKIKGKLEFRNVSFAYPTNPTIKVLDNLNFTINPGQSVAFVGYSGCGKSSVIQLIERFYDVIEGQVLIDDVNIKDYDLITYRKQVALVMQEPVLFKRDIIENISYGNLNADYKAIEEAATKAKISEFLSPSYDKSIIPVSGGQKQRLAIARALVKDPVILLLDEATSALDRENEKYVQESITEAMKGRTCIVVAHR
jgi:ATP-binding cassette subfamily B (MDR/TAP) protein 1